MDRQAERVKRLFQDCVALPQYEQLAHLERACPEDPELRQRVHELLAAYAEAESFLEGRPRGNSPRVGPPPAPPSEDTLTAVPNRTDTLLCPDPSEVGPGSKIGPYTIRERLGGGGMGVVWVAEQRSPIARLVALKLIKPALLTPDVLARFRVERQALAVMDHPSIARVLDAGDTANGAPYLVMELVRGTPITSYTDGHRLGVRERLLLFTQVCQAIQHIHQKGVIHRDIKPSNVLVAEYDGRAVPKVIDFGVAKSVYAALPGQPATTTAGLVGTLEYMSPEQAGSRSLSTDTRSDVYSLGVLLYELLTGRTPLGWSCPAGEELGEVLRRIREETPAPPSSRVVAGHDAAGAAESRRTQVQKWGAVLREELDWVVLRALEKDPERRYATANDLAADLLRYLNCEPVSARPPSRLYRLRKFVRRNRTAVLAAVLLLLTLVGGIIGTAIGLVQAVAARNDEAVQRRRAEDNARLAAEKAAAAKAAEANTASVLKFIGDRIVGTARPQGYEGGLGRNATIREAVDKAALYLDDKRAMADGPLSPLVEASLREWLAQVYRSLGEYQRAFEQHHRAIALFEKHYGPDHPETYGAKQGLAITYVADHQPYEAAKILEAIVPIARTRFGPDDPRTLATLNGLAATYLEAGRARQAVELYEEIRRSLQGARPLNEMRFLSATNNLAQAYTHAGLTAKAIELLESVLPRTRDVSGPEGANTLNARHGLASAYQKAGRLNDAAPLLKQVLESRRSVLGQNHPTTRLTVEQLAMLYVELDQPGAAGALLEEQLRAAREKFPPGSSPVAESTLLLAHFHGWRGDYARAEPLLRNCLADVDKTGPHTWLATVARLFLGWVLLEQHQPHDAEPLLSASLEGLEQHHGVLPPPFKADRVPRLCSRVGQLYEQASRPDRARAFRDAAELLGSKQDQQTPGQARKPEK